jgi:hypothetical protein
VATLADWQLWAEGALTCRVLRGGAKLGLLSARSVADRIGNVEIVGTIYGAMITGSDKYMYCIMFVPSSFFKKGLINCRQHAPRGVVGQELVGTASLPVMRRVRNRRKRVYLPSTA